MPYICIVFFMVLDLRLTMEIGCRDDNLFLFMDFPINIPLSPAQMQKTKAASGKCNRTLLYESKKASKKVPYGQQSAKQC